MLNVYELERQWLRYKIKYYLPITVAIASVTILSVTGLIFWSTNDTASVPTTEQKVAVQSTTIKQEPSVNNQQVAVVAPQTVTPQVTSQQPALTAVQTTPVQTPVQPAVQQNVLQPSMSFMSSIEQEVIPTYYQTEEVPVEEVVIETPRPTVVQKETVASVKPPVAEIKQETVVNTTRQVTAPSTSSVTITQEEANDLNDVIKRFKVNKSPALSLFLARRYYDLGQYDNAYEYALRTNELDSDIEESWLIFAKSQVKIGQKEQAVKTLKSYVQHSRSQRAKILLDEITQGKFQ